MAIAISKVTGGAYTAGNKRHRVFDVTISGTYTANGETVTNTQVGLEKIEQVVAPGAVTDSLTAPTIGNPMAVITASDGSSAKFVLFDSAADGDALDETPAETTTRVAFRATFIGY
jgi:hypothetical protein